MTTPAKPKPPPQLSPPRDPANPQWSTPVNDGLLTVRGMEHAALVFVMVQSVGQHQAEMMRTRLLSLADRSHGKIALSLENVADMTSAGINALVAVNVRCRDLGGSMAVFGLSKDIRKMLRVTRLDRAMTIVETAHEAVKSLDQPKKGRWSALAWARADKDAA